MVKSAKGVEIDMASIMAQNGSAVALGNARMNARGDLLGQGGKVLKTREEIASEYHTKNSKAVKNVPLGDEIEKMLKPDQPEQNKQIKKPQQKPVEVIKDKDTKTTKTEE